MQGGGGAQLAFLELCNPDVSGGGRAASLRSALLEHAGITRGRWWCSGGFCVARTWGLRDNNLRGFSSSGVVSLRGASLSRVDSQREGKIEFLDLAVKDRERLAGPREVTSGESSDQVIASDPG